MYMCVSEEVIPFPISLDDLHIDLHPVSSSLGYPQLGLRLGAPQLVFLIYFR